MRCRPTSCRCVIASLTSSYQNDNEVTGEVDPQPLNSSLQNGPWNEKQPEITKHSALALNREFLDYPKWDEDMIEERGRSLLAHALAIWPR